MNSHRMNTELTPAEREAYAALRRDSAPDVAAEERTVAALRASGFFTGDARVPRQSRRRQYFALAGAAAATVVAVIGASRVLVTHARPAPPPNVVSTPESTATTAPAYVVWY
jgi:hypothetical protein